MVSKLFLHFYAVVFWLYGLIYVLYPDLMLSFISGSEVANSNAAIDIRATYGGMSIAVGVFAHYTALNPARIKLGLIFVVLLMMAMALTRALGIVFEASANSAMYLLLISEIAAALVAAVLLQRSKRTQYE